ncbi:methyltransferase [Legionella maioricensis]|uniref:Methyltransferase n=1 Tax=Legionella maioricensis TaxID=2896528 RepID=A0A9X2ICK8_9GAMM|nr:methyltransferase [Legionella maioricensis]MCL9685326.1 methyltransferase [Legionella maioricensis]MCL9688712.1 methyltransferase [Legionella maioricensis]
MDVESTPAHIQLAIMSRDYVVSRSIQAIAKLGIADHMSDKLTPVGIIAKKTSTIPELLDRLLSFLSAYGLFTKVDDSYALTSLSYPLQQDNAHSIKEVLCMVDESWWQAFAHLDTELKTGVSAFKLQHGIDFFNYLDQHAETKTNYEKGLAVLSTFDDKAITQGYDFGQHQHLVNIGNKTAGLTNAINTRYPAVFIHNLDINFQLNIQELNDQLKNLQHIDGYLVKALLHDYSETVIKQVLHACYTHMPNHSSLIIAEQIIPNDPLPHTNKTMDIIMMVLVGGRQRTLTNWQELIESSGFKLTSTYPTSGLLTLMEYKILK